MQTQHIHIIGAGIGGLSLALLLQSKGLKVTIYESHSIPGGCASWYKKGPYRFDVGATTLSGVSQNGPLLQFLNEVDIQIEMEQIDPGMVIHHDKGKLKRTIDEFEWVAQLNQLFPDSNHKDFWSKVSLDAQKCWRLLDNLENFPPNSLSDLLSQFDTQLIRKVKLVHLLFKSFKNYSNGYLNNPELKRILDQLLLISTQSHSDVVPALVGVLGAHYPTDTWYPIGGIGAFAEKLAKVFVERGGVIHFKTKLNQIEFSHEEYKMNFSNNLIVMAKDVVINLPLWNIESLCSGKMKNYFSKQSSKVGEAWGAMTCYGIIRNSEPINELYHQIHDNKEGSLFFSFSRPGDTIRSPLNEQVFSVSTHVKDDEIRPRKSDKESYLKSKIEFQERVERCLVKYFKIIEFEIDSVGTPQTFHRFTQRHKGWVGGIPHRLSLPLWNYPGAVTPFKGFWRVGDTVFPGQGIVGVISGAKILAKRILG